MIIRTADTGPLHHAALGPAAIAALVVALFVAILLIGLLVPLRYAHGWTEMFFISAMVGA